MRVIILFLLIVLSVAFTVQASLASPSMDKDITGHNKKVILYPRFLIMYSSDFGAFKTYMNESKEEYRTRRSRELISASKGIRDISSYNNTAGPYGVTNSSSEIITSGVDPEVIKLMLQAYDKFDNSYDINKSASRRNIGIELSGQLQAKLLNLKENNLISDDNSQLDVTSGKYSIEEMDDRIAGASGGFSTGRTAAEMANIATHFLYGFWSYSSLNQIKVTIFIEAIGGNIRTFEAVGSEEGGAMDKIAKMIFTYLHANRNFNDPVANFHDFKIVRPNSVTDVKSHTEADSFCAEQGAGFRLPYANEVVAMLSQPFGPNGNIFLSTDKSYTVADLQGGVLPLKIVPGYDKEQNYSLQETSANERLSYFCVKGGNVEEKSSVDNMYNKLYTGFSEFRLSHGNKITTELCSDDNNSFGIKTMKDIAIKIAQSDQAPNIKGVVKNCMITYLKKRPELFKELMLLRSI